MRTRDLVVAGVIAMLTVAGCGGGSSTPSKASSTAGSAPRARHDGAGLSRDEFAAATKAAKDQQRRVSGRFVGATARQAGRGLLRVRLVWDSANFDHGSVARGGPPDGPRKALLFTLGTESGRVSQFGARYRDVGAGNDETLLYGRWPDPAVS